jgi:hypothetical protein
MENLKRGCNLRDLDVGGRIILKFILKEEDHESIECINVTPVADLMNSLFFLQTSYSGSTHSTVLSNWKVI